MRLDLDVADLEAKGDGERGIEFEPDQSVEAEMGEGRAVGSPAHREETGGRDVDIDAIRAVLGLEAKASACREGDDEQPSSHGFNLPWLFVKINSMRGLLP